MDIILIYLDTEEFRSLFDWKRVIKEVKVIEPEFHVLKNGKLTTPSVWAKTCRGAMTRFIIENHITDPSGLLDFEYEGFRYRDDVAETDVTEATQHHICSDLNYIRIINN